MICFPSTGAQSFCSPCRTNGVAFWRRADEAIRISPGACLQLSKELRQSGVQKKTLKLRFSFCHHHLFAATSVPSNISLPEVFSTTESRYRPGVVSSSTDRLVSFNSTQMLLRHDLFLPSISQRLFTANLATKPFRRAIILASTEKQTQRLCLFLTDEIHLRYILSAEPL